MAPSELFTFTLADGYLYGLPANQVLRILDPLVDFEEWDHAQDTDREYGYQAYPYLNLNRHFFGRRYPQTVTYVILTEEDLLLGVREPQGVLSYTPTSLLPVPPYLFPDGKGPLNSVFAADQGIVALITVKTLRP